MNRTKRSARSIVSRFLKLILIEILRGMPHIAIQGIDVGRCVPPFV